jgi:hypothetical protein
VGRRNAALNAASVAVARRLADSENAAARWVGKGALKELTSTAVQAKLTSRRRTPSRPKAAAPPARAPRREKSRKARPRGDGNR